MLKRITINSKILKNASFSGLMHITNPLMQLITTPIIILLIGSEEYGIWLFFFSILGFMSALQFGLGDSIIRLVAQNKNNKVKLFRIINSSAILYFIIIIIIGLLLIVYKHHIINLFILRHSSLYDMDYLAGIFHNFVLALILHFILQISLSILKGYDKYDTAAIVQMTNFISLHTLSLGLAFLSKDLLIISYAPVISYFLATLFGAFKAKKILETYKFQIIWDINVYKEVVGYSIVIWSNSLAWLLYAQLDRFVVSGILGPTALALYGIALQLSNQVYTLTSSVFSFLLPKFSVDYYMTDKKHFFKRYYTFHIASILFANLIGATLYFYSYEILNVWLNKNIALNAQDLTNILTISMSILVISIVPGYFLVAIKKAHVSSLFGWLRTLLLTILLFFLVIKVGVIGAALSKLFVLVIDIVFVSFVQKSLFKIKRFTIFICTILFSIYPYITIFISEKFNVCQNSLVKFFIWFFIELSMIVFFFKLKQIITKNSDASIVSWTHLS